MLHTRIPLQKTTALISLKILWKAVFIKVAGFKFATLLKSQQLLFQDTLLKCRVRGYVTFMISRRNRLKVFNEKSILKNFAKFTGKHLFRSLFSKKL